MSVQPVRVKVCGLTNPEDARAVAAAGVDAIGLNFVAGPRKIDAPRARAILDAIPDPVQAWLLLDVGADDPPDDVQALLSGGRISHVQMYGQETADAIARIHDVGLQAVAVRRIESQDTLTTTGQWLDAMSAARPDLLLIDAGGGGQRLGGTGRAWDWNDLRQMRDDGLAADWPPIVVAGGLTPDNVAQAIRTIAPAWVDTSSGVERSPGVKDPAKAAAFVQAARTARL
ncbi:MAG: phosphoribosylanthranilate isomerase [bacterium]|nr:phosphoribosylanthranilate isomerase [bacterium]